MKKEVLIGILVGFVANSIGLYFATLYFGHGKSFGHVIRWASAEGMLGKLISLGAILNLIAFFVFIKKKQDYRARGVLLVTIVVAVSTFVSKII